MTKAALSLATTLVLGTSLLAQLRVDVRLVNVVATVTDGRDRYVTNLVAEDFTVQEDGVPHGTALFDGVLSGLDKVRKGKHREIRLKNPEYTIRYKQDYFGG